MRFVIEYNVPLKEEVPYGGPACHAKFPMIALKAKEVKTRVAQEKELSCRDFRQDCGFSAKAKTEKEVLDKCWVHACSAHGQCNDSPEIREKIRSRIRDVL